MRKLKYNIRFAKKNLDLQKGCELLENINSLLHVLLKKKTENPIKFFSNNQSIPLRSQLAACIALLKQRFIRRLHLKNIHRSRKRFANRKTSYQISTS